MFRSDVAHKFKLGVDTLNELIDTVDDLLEYVIRVEAPKALTKDSISNYDQVKEKILKKLTDLRDRPFRKENPLIYHLDVAAMYPNIILTNRLQPSATVTPEICAACDFNQPENKCQRIMKWVWRGDYIPADRSDYEWIKAQLESEQFPNPKYQQQLQSQQKYRYANQNYALPPQTISFHQLPEQKQNQLLTTRLKEFSKRAYKISHKVESEERETTICQRENSFYVDTVRAFRDRRYIYKGKLKEAQKNLANAHAQNKSQVEKQEAEKLVVLYDSLQLAHKCILNSFYGYVMRRGARWYR